jgi:hypothetical protein
MTNTISAGANPDLANDLINKVLAEKPVEVDVQLTLPSDTSVTLPGGYINAAGEVVTEAEVRELTGQDEEAVAKSSTLGKALMTIIQRGTVKIGKEKASEDILDKMLAGDRDALLIGIFRATFGNTAELKTWCNECSELKDVEVDVNQDIKTKVLVDPMNDRVFTVKGRKQEITLRLPTGFVQKELITNADKTSAELNTILLEHCVVKIGESPVLSKFQVQAMGLTDRQLCIEEINNRVPGPQFDAVEIVCPDCESEVKVPINLGNLFRL